MEKLKNFKDSKDEEVKYAEFNKEEVVAIAKKYSKLLKSVGRL